MTDHLRTLDVSLQDLQQLAGESRLYGVLDACDAPAIQSKIAELGSSRALCLYRGEVAPEILQVAPYLVKIDERLLEWLISSVWMDAWGILLVARLEPSAVWRHLRKFLFVKDSNGEVMYFRYYDPRVLEPFLTSCNSQELVNFFGSIFAFGISAQNGQRSGILFHNI